MEAKLRAELLKSPAFAGLILSAVIILSYGACAFITSIPVPPTASSDEKGKVAGDEDFLTVATESKEVLAYGAVREILIDFAATENIAQMTQGDSLLRDVADEKEDDLRARLEKAEVELEEEAGGLEDAVEARSYANAATKVCIARSIMDGDLKTTCDLTVLAAIDAENIDDLTAVEAVLPAFLSGMACFVDGDYAKARAFLEMVTEHKEKGIVRWNNPEFPLGNKLYRKIQDETSRILADGKLTK